MLTVELHLFPMINIITACDMYSKNRGGADCFSDAHKAKCRTNKKMGCRRWQNNSN